MKKLVLLAAVLLVSVTSAYAQFTFTSIDYPGAELTHVYGINNTGVMVGAYRLPGDTNHAMMIKKGKFIPLAPTTILATNWSQAFKINNCGDIVGWVSGDDGFFHGFLLRRGVLTLLDFPGASETRASGINDSGTISGTWYVYDAQGNLLSASGFTWKFGNFADVVFPGAGETYVYGINDFGDLTGSWDSGPTATTASGFVFSHRRFITFDAPFLGVLVTQGDDINSTGKIVGQYIDDTTYHGFLKVGNTFTSIDYPGATLTTAWGINSAGQMVGNWVDSSGATHGWLAAQPNTQNQQ
jgi:uncharacterized membrane protein